MHHERHGLHEQKELEDERIPTTDGPRAAEPQPKRSAEKPQRREERREGACGSFLCVLRVSVVEVGLQKFAQAAETSWDSGTKYTKGSRKTGDATTDELR
jgi:hypothetical protein